MHLHHATRAGIVAGCVLIAVLVLLAYGDMHDHAFLNWDDIPYIVANEHVQILSLDNLRWMFTEFYFLNWHPLTWLTFAIDYQLWGHNAVAYKLVNISIHILVSITLFFTGKELVFIAIGGCSTGNCRARETAAASALIGALLFAVHPQHVESVIWISERKDVLCGLFYLLAMFSYLRQVEDELHEKRWRNLTLIAATLALMSKPMAVTLPVSLMLLDIYPLQRKELQHGWSRAVIFELRDKGVLIAVTTAVALITVTTQLMEIQGLATLGMTGRIVTACAAILHYIGTIFFPVDLVAFYPYQKWMTNPDWQSTVPCLFFIFLVIVSWALWRRGMKAPLATIIFLLVTIAPVSGVVKVGNAAFADRYAYIPTMGLYLLLGYALAVNSLQLLSKSRRAASGVIVIAIIGSSVYLTNMQKGDWRDDLSLWHAVISVYPDQSTIPYNNLGATYFHQGKYEQSIKNFNKAIAVDPHDTGVYENIVRAHEHLDDVETAARYIGLLLQNNPGNADASLIAGDFYYRQKRFQDAQRSYDHALYLQPDRPDTLFKSAIMDYTRQDFVPALNKLDRVLTLDPEYVLALQMMVQIQLHAGNRKVAAEVARRILTVDPGNKYATDILAEIAPNMPQGP